MNTDYYNQNNSYNTTTTGTPNWYNANNGTNGYGINYNLPYQVVREQSPQFYDQNPQMQGRLKGRPVTSIEEARALSIDLDGSVFYFPDAGNKKIYTKQYNADGSASFKEYVEHTPTETQVKYVTQQELATAMESMRAMFTGYLAGLSNIPSTSKNSSSLEKQNIETSQQVFNI